jgi:putative spermidine/putrescine transport system permease protein
MNQSIDNHQSQKSRSPSFRNLWEKIGLSLSGILTKNIWSLIIIPTLFFLLFFFFYPIGQILIKSVFDPHFTSEHYLHIFREATYIKVLYATLKVSFFVTVITLVLAYPVAYVLANASPRVKGLMILCILMPFWTSILVRTYAWMIILQQRGIVNYALLYLGIIDEPIKLMYNTPGVYIGMIHVLYPYMVLPIFSVMTNIDRSLDKAAMNLGATPFQSFLRVYLPLSMPGVGAGVLLVFILAMGFFITPALLGGIKNVMIAQIIEVQVNELLKWGFAGALAMVLLAVLLLTLFLFSRILRLDRIWGGAGNNQIQFQSDDGIKKGLINRTFKWALDSIANRVWNLSHSLSKWIEGNKNALRRLFKLKLPEEKAPGKSWTTYFLYTLTTLVLLFEILPIFIVIPMSFSAGRFLRFPPPGLSLQWYEKFFQDYGWLRATVVSFEVAGLTMILATILGTLAAFGIVRGRFGGKKAAIAFIISPRIIPEIITAISLYYMFVRFQLVGSVIGLTLAHTVLAIPFVTVIVTSALNGFDESLEQAAMNLGAGPLRTFWKVTLPILKPAILSGATFAFIISFDELILALFLAGQTSATLPRKMWEGLRMQINPTVSAVSSMMIGVSVVAFVVMETFRNRFERYKAMKYITTEELAEINVPTRKVMKKQRGRTYNNPKEKDAKNEK